MFPALILALAVFVVSVLSQITFTAQQSAQVALATGRTVDVQDVGRAITSYVEKYGNAPTSLAVLQAESGNEFIARFTKLPHVGYAVSPVLVDTNWRYQRVTVFAQDPASSKSVAEYLSAAKNSCGTADFNTAESWCGDKGSMWFRLETRELYGTWLKRQKLRQNATISKLTEAYNVNGQFPVMPSTSATLASLTGYTGNARQCSGVYLWAGLPFDCNDLFSMFGTPITVNRLDADTAALVAATPILNASGTALASVTIIPLRVN